MAEASRFPHLALPFALTGAAAGWLSASMAGNPLLQNAETNTAGPAALVATVLGGLTGALLTRFCVGKRYWYDLSEPDPEARAPGDRWWRHVVAVLLAGAATGAIIAAVCHAYINPFIGAVGGMACAVGFFPVCAAVILAARSAQRARLGSIVAGSDRRAVWGILASALAVTTLCTALNWPASATGDVPVPTLTLAILGACGIVIAAVLLADKLAYSRAKAALLPGLVEHHPESDEAADSSVPRLDLGLGHDMAARVARSAWAYRGRDRALALVQGNAEQALSALRRAIRRGTLGLAATFTVLAVHGAANTGLAQRLFDERACEHESYVSCGRAADVLRRDDPLRAAALYESACLVSDAASCETLAIMLERGEGQAIDTRRAAHYHDLACDAGAEESCRSRHWQSLLEQRALPEDEK